MKKVTQTVYKYFLVFNFLFFVVFTNKVQAQCSTGSSPSYSNSCTSDYYTSVTASGTGVTSTIGITGSSCAGVYFNYFATQGITAPGGTIVNMNVSRYATYNAYLSVYIDWNNNGTYEASELAGTVLYLPISILTTTYSFAIPTSGIVTGTNLHMRMMLSELSTGAPCTANWGETCDFYINVTCTTPVISVSPASPGVCSGGSGVGLTASGAGAGGTYSWTPATGLSATTGAFVTANPAATTVYSVIGTSTGCSATSTVMVTFNSSPLPVTGVDTVCSGSSVFLSDAVLGGTWSSNNITLATVDPSTGLVYGISPGNAEIVYTLGGGCAVTTTVTINVSPSPIIGSTGVCSGYTTTLSDAVFGGVWSSDNLLVASVSIIGDVSGISSGTADISYTIGSCATGILMTVNTLSPITGGGGVCVGLSIPLSDITPGGVWSSGGVTAATVSVSGVVTGVASGSATIYYTLGACAVSHFVTVDYPVAAITGSFVLCEGSTTTLNDMTAGGVWSSANAGVAGVSGGLVTGLSAGTADISYAVGGCSANAIITVNANNAGIIVGKDSVCAGPGHIIALSDSVSGGVWSSTNTSRATVDPAAGIVSGGLSGIDTIKYIVTNSCGTFVAKFVLHVRTSFQCATGINESAPEQITELKMYPNPNRGTFIMNLVSDVDEETHITVTNIVGEKVRTFAAATNKEVEIRLDPVPGVYFLSAYTSHGSYVAKVIIN